MSRTYRKYRHGGVTRFWDAHGEYSGKFSKSPTKKELADRKRDGRAWPVCGPYFHRITKKRRRNDLLELRKVYRCDDFEEYDFDDTPHVMKRKGIWWDIY